MTTSHPKEDVVVKHLLGPREGCVEFMRQRNVSALQVGVAYETRLKDKFEGG